MYKPFGWEVLDLRYGGTIARLETMHQRLIAYLDTDNTSTIKLEELEVEQGVSTGAATWSRRRSLTATKQVVFEGQRLNLMLDYARVSRPTYI